MQIANWVVGGPSGAAARLGLKRNTLIAKMKKFGILRPVPSDDRDELTDSLQGVPAASCGLVAFGEGCRLPRPGITRRAEGSIGKTRFKTSQLHPTFASFVHCKGSRC